MKEERDAERKTRTPVLLRAVYILEPSRGSVARRQDEEVQERTQKMVLFGEDM